MFVVIPARLAFRRPENTEVERFCVLLEEIQAGAESGQDVSELIARWNARASRPFTVDEFLDFEKSVDALEFVTSALGESPRWVPDLTYAETVTIVRCVLHASVVGAEYSHFLDWLELQFPDSNAAELILWPNVWFGDAAALTFEFTPEQVLEGLMVISGRRLPDAPTVPLPFEVPRRPPGGRAPRPVSPGRPD